MNHNNLIIVSIAILILIFTFSCSGGKMEEQKTNFDSLNDVPDDVWEKLSEKKIYFGHKSVGYNILEGVEDIIKDNPKIKLNVVESTDPDALTAGTLAHSRVGKNTQPKTKIDAFAKYIDSGIGEKADIAALKFCYVDMEANTEPEKLFMMYENEIDKIRKTYPDLTIIHFTLPLTTLQTGPKAWVKKIIGRPVYGFLENINRYKYNELMRAKYQDEAPILDIATIESTYPDGTRSTFEADGKTYYSMVPQYTDDGGHLNEVGRKRVAEQLILLLANL